MEPIQITTLALIGVLIFVFSYFKSKADFEEIRKMATKLCAESRCMEIKADIQKSIGDEQNIEMISNFTAPKDYHLLKDFINEIRGGSKTSERIKMEIKVHTSIMDKSPFEMKDFADKNMELYEQLNKLFQYKDNNLLIEKRVKRLHDQMDSVKSTLPDPKNHDWNNSFKKLLKDK